MQPIQQFKLDSTADIMETYQHSLEHFNILWIFIMHESEQTYHGRLAKLKKEQKEKARNYRKAQRDRLKNKMADLRKAIKNRPPTEKEKAWKEEQKAKTKAWRASQREKQKELKNKEKEKERLEKDRKLQVTILRNQTLVRGKPVLKIVSSD